MIHLIADENIANLHDYLQHHDICVHKMAGRDIDRHAIAKHQAQALWIRSVSPINADSTGDDTGKVSTLKFVGSATIGTDHVDTAWLDEQGIDFTNASGCSKHSVAQYVITAILTLRPQYATTPMRLGIIGLGNIGSSLANHAKKLGWQVAGFDPYLPTSDINNSTLDDLLSKSDVISLHTPLTKTGLHPTYRWFDDDIFAKIQPNSLLINTARGEILCQDALLHAIFSRQLQVVLDVFPHEPTISRELLDAIDIATPHIAGYTLEGKIRGTDMIYQAFCRSFKLPILQNMQPLLPPNQLQFTDFCAGVKVQPTQTLQAFYDITKDDGDLRAVCDDTQIHGKDFDALRKNYPLRREWLV